MLDSIIRWSLRYRGLVLFASLATLIYGSILAASMPIDVFPDLDRPRVIVITECPGLATEEVEALVTQPIEIALSGAAGITAIRSQSTAGLNVIYLEFDWSTDVRTARQTVQERLTTLDGVLPEGIRPIMTPPSSIMGQIVVAGAYRSLGPKGGELTPLEDSPFVAETMPTTGAADFYDRTDGSTVAARPPDERTDLAIWQPTDRREVADWKRIEVERIEWLPSTSADLEAGIERRAVVTIAGRDYRLAFPDADRRQMELRTLADWVVRPRLLQVRGVAEVFQMGGERKQYQVLVDPAALLEFGVSLQQVEQAVRASNANGTGGFAIVGETERPIRILGRLGPDADQVLEQLRKIPVRVTPRRSILLEEVARVTEGAQLKRGDASISGRPGVVFTVVKQPHADTRRLTDDVEAALAESEAALPIDIVIASDLFRLKTFIDRGVFNVGEALVIGALLVVVILFLFLLNFRTTFITLTAIPLSLVVTTIVFRLIGLLTGTDVSINVMTLGGIAVAMGELVDDAIVDVENIFRRLRENRRRSAPLPTLQVVYAASREIRGAIVFGTCVVILVFLPLFALSGIEGRLFAPLGAAYIVSILASLLISLTVTPALSSYLLPESSAIRREHESSVLAMLKRLATPVVRASMATPALWLTLTWVAVAIAAVEFSRLGRDFLPKFDEGSIQINVTLPPGSSLEASNRSSAIIDAKLASLQRTPERPDGPILQFVRRTGRAELDEHAAPVNTGEYILSMNPDIHRDRAEMIRTLLEDLRAEVPGVDIEVEQPLAHMISHMVSGVYAQIAVRIHGDDLDRLVMLAERAKRAIESTPGITPPVIEPIRSSPELHVRLRPDELAFRGMTRADVTGVLQTAIRGSVVSQVLDGQRRFDLLVRLDDAARNDLTSLERLRLDLPDGRGQIELGEIADIDEGLGPNAVMRENARRRIVIRCNTQGRDLASAVAEIEQRIRRDVDLPEGYFVEFGGQFESQQRATRTIGLLALVSLAGMFVVLLLLFPSVRIVLQILNALPTAFIGGVAALVITRQDLTIASLVGFISLGGIAVRNGILLVTHYLHLMRDEGESFSQEMILRGSLERLAPVLMTALTAGIGLVPLVVGGHEPGREILYPVATVILGGLVTSTFCEFLIHPGLFWRFSGRDAARVSAANGSSVDDL
ncbi:MAG TPA: efflux RND transporter permease subunit [Pirellulaceae bacterium]|nr:efflux RND transporter permease subunit [Pirellulaceae bacterium]